MATNTPVKRDEIPYTTARLKSLIKVYCTYGGYLPDPNDPTALPALDKLVLVGSIQTLTIKDPRGGAERRELNYDRAAEILEMIPGLESFDVSMNYVMLYSATFMEACGFAGHEVKNNTRPILFSVVLPSPTPDTIPPKVLLLRGCWIKDNPHTFDVEQKDDLRIIQDVPLLCAGIIEVKG